MHSLRKQPVQLLILLVFFFKTKVTIHPPYAKPHALKIKMKENKAGRQRACLQTLRRLAEELDNMIRIYCKLPASHAFPPLSGEILP